MKDFWAATIKYSIILRFRHWLFFSRWSEVEFVDLLPEYFLAPSEKSAKDLVSFSDWWRRGDKFYRDIIEEDKDILGYDIQKTVTVEKVKTITLLDMMSDKISEEDYMNYVLERLENA